MRFVNLTAVSAAASLAVAGTMAQTTNNTTSSSSLIPTGITQACTDFMTKLNSDSSIQSCTAPLLSATQFYANATSAANSNSSSSGSASALTDSLSQLCDTNTGCDAGLIRKYLAQFWTACMPEIRAKNGGVLGVYDVLYLINPFHQAVCTKDDSNNFCVLNIATNTAAKTAASSTTSKRSLFSIDEAPLRKRQDSASEVAQAIDSSSLSNSSIAFLYLQTTSDKSVLCSSCSKNVMASYISFETSIPYAIGLANSLNLKGQSALYSTMKETCGDDFTKSVNQVAGTTAIAEVGGAGSLSIRAGLAFALGSFVTAAVLL